MRHRTGIFVLWGTLGAVACGGASSTDFSNAPGAGGTTTSGGANGSGGSGAKGGTGAGGSSSGTGGSTSSGGSVSTGGSSATSGTGGDATGATGGSDMTTGGSAGTDAAGGSGGAGATGGTDAAGGSGATGGTDATGGTAGTSGTTGTGGTDGSGMQMGGAGGVAGSPAGGAGGMNPDCNALEMDYSMTLEQAEACNPNSGKDQCTQMEKGDLVCGCSVYVNPDNQAAIMHLDDLRKQAGTHCTHACPAIACVLPSATCMAVSGSKTEGRCSNVLATTQ